jgi:hypothetical protein
VCVSSASEQQCYDYHLWRLGRVRNRRRQAAHKLKLNSSAASPWHHKTLGFETVVDGFDAVAHLARRCTIGFLEGPELQNRICHSAKGPSASGVDHLSATCSAVQTTRRKFARDASRPFSTSHTRPISRVNLQEARIVVSPVLRTFCC